MRSGKVSPHSKSDDGSGGSDGLGTNTLLWMARLIPAGSAALLLLLYSIAEAWIHAYYLEDRGMMSHLLDPDAIEILLRVVVLVIATGSAIAASFVLVFHVRSIERQRARERKLSAAAYRFAYSSSESRRELSRDLHEGLVQQLVAAQMFMRGMRSSSSCGDAAGELEQADKILGGAIRTCRDIAQQMSPQILEEYGLIPALEVAGANIERQSGKVVAVKSGDQPQLLELPVLHMAFDVIERLLETLAGAPAVTSVSVSSKVLLRWFVVSVTWDGEFDPDVTVESHYADSVGAIVRTSSPPRRRIDFSLPIGTSTEKLESASD